MNKITANPLRVRSNVLEETRLSPFPAATSWDLAMGQQQITGLRIESWKRSDCAGVRKAVEWFEWQIDKQLQKNV